MAHGSLQSWLVALGFFGLEDEGYLLRDVTRTGAGQLVCVNEESSVRVTGINREHPMVDKLLGAL